MGPVRRFRSLPPLGQRSIAAAAAALFLFGSSRFAPDPREQAKVQIAILQEDQRRAHEAWKATRREAGETWDRSEAERVEKEVLTPWRAARRRLNALLDGPEARYVPSAFVEFFRLREESWTALIEAVRTGDAGLFRRHAEAWAAAEAAGAKLAEWPERPVATLAAP